MSKSVAEGPGRCPRCIDRVYAAEEVVCDGQKWHKKCFGCKDCGKKLDSTTCNTHDGRSDYSCPQTRVVQLLEHSPPTTQSASGSKIGVDVMCEGSLLLVLTKLLQEISLRVLRFLPLLKNQHVLHFDQHISCLGLLPLVVIYHY